jgi:mannose-6-phosphate isomerase-like protein (cupin superfamily)
MTVIEFHTVPRPDLVPPRPTMTFPSSAVPASVPEGRNLVKQIEGSGGPSGAAPTMIGETCVLRWRRLTRGAPAVDVHPDATGAELFAYIVRGDVELTSGSSTLRIAAGNLIVIPAGTRHVRLRAIGDGDVGLAEFIAARR